MSFIDGGLLIFLRKPLSIQNNPPPITATVKKPNIASPPLVFDSAAKPPIGVGDASIDSPFTSGSCAGVGVDVGGDVGVGIGVGVDVGSGLKVGVGLGSMIGEDALLSPWQCRSFQGTPQ